MAVNLRIQPPRAGEDPPRNVIARRRYLATLKLADEHFHDLPVKLRVSRACGHDSKLGQLASGPLRICSVDQCGVSG